MKAILRWAALAPVVALGCTPVQSFSPASGVSFEPTPEEVAVPLLETAPEKYEVVGYAQVRAESIGEALPYLQKQARKHGGTALLNLRTTTIYLSVMSYEVTVIRHAKTGP